MIITQQENGHERRISVCRPPDWGDPPGYVPEICELEGRGKDIGS